MDLVQLKYFYQERISKTFLSRELIIHGKQLQRTM